jgi:hypothetical protein
MRAGVAHAALILAGVAGLVVGCGTSTRALGPTDGTVAECAGDGDCTLAASTCCGCPTFAEPVAADAACAAVDCPAMTCPANVRAACEPTTHACVLACVPLACPSSCPSGYAVDAAGCATCDCASANAQGCSVDADCVRVPADCCGCAGGGADTAVPSGEVAAHLASLACPPSPACPNIDVCTPGEAPRCTTGTCTLMAAPALPAAACGRADLPACPPPTTCTVNADPTATQLGLGVCL